MMSTDSPRGASGADGEAPERPLRSALVVGLGTTASRVLGLLRDVVIAHGFGAAAGADAFFVAFRIPNLLRRLFAEGAFAQAFVPVLSEYRLQEGPEAVRDLVAHTAGALAAVLVVVSVIGVVAAPVLVWIFAPGFVDDSDRAGLTAQMLRITFPYILLISLTALGAAALNAFGRFAIPALTPALLNVALIGAALILAPRMDEPVVALAWGVVAGGVAQLAFQLPFVARVGLLVRPRLRRGHAGVRRIVALIVPALFGVSVAQINVLVDTVIASLLVTGSVSWLYYSDRLVEFPLGVFGIALATVILPFLSRRHAAGDAGPFSATLDWALRLVAVVGVPAAAGIAVLAAPMLVTVFQYGAFGDSDVAMASRSLAAYALGLLGFIGVKVLAPGYYSRQDTRTPVRIAAIAMAGNVVLNLALVFPLAHAGLALATSLSAYLNAGLLLRGLIRERVYQPRPGWVALLARVGVAVAVMALVLALARGDTSAWSEWPAVERAVRLAVLVALGMAVYAGALLVLGVRVAELRRPRGA